MSSLVKRWFAVGTAAAIAVFGLTAATPSAWADMTDVATNEAASHIATNLPKKSSTSANIDSALALASTGQCTYAAPLRTLVGRLEDQTAAYIKGAPAAAAKLAIAVDALGLDPEQFGGKNLVAAVTKDLPANGDVGNYPFSQSLALIALDRVGATIPDSMVTRLVEEQNGDGSFGTDDPDSTALAITALHAVADSVQEQDALDDAIAWATSHQTGAGYWENYSPVDSTGLMGAAAALVGEDEAAAAARAWLLGQQLDDGGFANSLDGTSSNLMATADALWLLSGTSHSTVSLDLSSCGDTPPALPTATSSCSGVWVLVDRGNGQTTTRCATAFGTGVEALQSAGLAVKTFPSSYGDAICQIRKFPATCDTDYASGYWSYWNATQNEDGTWGAWTYAATGAATSSPTRGVAEAHLWIPASIPWTADPAPTPSVTPPAGYTATPTPVIAGKAKVGTKLKAVPGTWEPAPDRFTYKWYRNGSAIKAATAKTYKLKKADKGKRISVKVTAKGDGLQTVAVMSAKTKKVKK